MFYSNLLNLGKRDYKIDFPHFFNESGEIINELVKKYFHSNFGITLDELPPSQLELVFKDRAIYKHLKYLHKEYIKSLISYDDTDKLISFELNKTIFQFLVITLLLAILFIILIK